MAADLDSCVSDTRSGYDRPVEKRRVDGPGPALEQPTSASTLGTSCDGSHRTHLGGRAVGIPTWVAAVAPGFSADGLLHHRHPSPDVHRLDAVAAAIAARAAVVALAYATRLHRFRADPRRDDGGEAVWRLAASSRHVSGSWSSLREWPRLSKTAVTASPRLMPTEHQALGALGEKEVCRRVECPRCRQRDFVGLPRNFPCADVICKFCGFLAQVKSGRVSAGPRVREVLGGAWQPQQAQIAAGIFHALFIASFDAARLVAIDYIPSHIVQACPSIFVPRAPLRPSARRAGWQGFKYDLSKLPEIGIFRLYPQGGKKLSPETSHARNPDGT